MYYFKKYSGYKLEQPFLSNLFNCMIFPQQSHKTFKQLVGLTFFLSVFLLPIGKVMNDSKKS